MKFGLKALLKEKGEKSPKLQLLRILYQKRSVFCFNPLISIYNTFEEATSCQSTISFILQTISMTWDLELAIFCLQQLLHGYGLWGKILHPLRKSVSSCYLGHLNGETVNAECSEMGSNPPFSCSIIPSWS